MTQRFVAAWLLVCSTLPTPSTARGQVADSSAGVSSDGVPPWRRTLPKEEAARADRLSGEIEEMRCAGRYAEALRPAEEHAGIRIRHQGADHWESVDAAMLVETLRHIATLSAEARAELAEADRATAEYLRLSKGNEFIEASLLVERQLEIRRRWLGADHVLTGVSLTNLATVLQHRGDYPRAEELQRQALGVLQRGLGDDHPLTADAMDNLGTVLIRLDRPAPAEPLMRRAIEIRKRVLGDTHTDVAVSLNNLANLLDAQDRQAEAIPLMRDAIEIFRGAKDEPSMTVAVALNNLGKLLSEQDELDEAESMYRQSLAAFRDSSGDPYQVGIALTNLGLLLDERSRYAEAESLLREALDILGASLEDGHPVTALCVHNLASVLDSQGEFAAAEATYRRALDMFRKNLGHEHSSIATTMHNLAYLLDSISDYDGAESLYHDALAMRRRLLGPAHGDVADTLDNLAALYTELGKLAEAESLHRQALSVRRALGGDDDADVALSMNNLGHLMLMKGDYGAAEPLLRDSLSVLRSRFGADDRRVATAVNNLAYLYHKRGDFAKAESLYRESLDVLRAVTGGDPSRIVLLLNNLATAVRDRGDLEAAEPLVTEALTIARSKLPARHPHLAAAINNLAVLRRDTGDLAGAESACRESLRMWEELLGADNPRVVQSLNNLSIVLRARKNYAEQEAALRRALSIAEASRTRLTGDERERARYAKQLRLADIAAYLAEVLVRLDRAEAAFEALERGRARDFLDLLARGAKDIVADARTRGDGRLATRLDPLLDNEARCRSALVTAERLIGITRARVDLPDDERKTLVDEQTDAVLRVRRELRDAELAVLAVLRDEWPDVAPASVARIRGALRTDELILTFAWTTDSVVALLVPPAGQKDVIGRIVADEKEEVRSLADAVDQAVGYASSVPSGTRDDAAARNRLARLFRRLLPDPIAGEVMKARRVIVIPAGPLNGLAFETLYVGAADAELDGKGGGSRGDNHPGQPWLLAGPELVYAASGTVFANHRRHEGGPDDEALHSDDRSIADPEHQTVRASERAPQGTRLRVLILGNPALRREARRVEPPTHGVLIEFVAEGSNASRAALRPGDVILTYAGAEVQGIESFGARLGQVRNELEAGERKSDDRIAIKYWRLGKVAATTVAPGALGIRPWRGSPSEGLDIVSAAAGPAGAGVARVSATDQVRLYGAPLSELPGAEVEARSVASVVRRSGGRAMLLLGKKATVGGLESAAHGQHIIHLATHGLTGSTDRPYDASLVLAQPEIPTSDDIGFLTLERLIRGWRGKLANCDLVVLSACDSQRGVKAGDSVMALPWGFMYAGASAVVASLWKVDDAATALLMDEFYRNMLERNMTKAAALRSAKQALRSMTWEEAGRRSRASKEQLTSLAMRGPPGKAVSSRGEPIRTLPFGHPHFWAAFVLIGDPEVGARPNGARELTPRN